MMACKLHEPKEHLALKVVDIQYVLEHVREVFPREINHFLHDRAAGVFALICTHCQQDNFLGSLACIKCAWATEMK